MLGKNLYIQFHFVIDTLPAFHFVIWKFRTGFEKKSSV